MVTWWKGEGNAADSAGTTAGTIVGTVTFTAGEVNQCFVFDGNNGDYVSFGSPTSLKINTFTAEGWIRRTNGSSVHNGGGNAVWLGFAGSGKGWACYLTGAGVVSLTSQGGVSNANSVLSLTGTGWHHIATALDGTAKQAFFWLDGVADGPYAFNDPPFAFGSTTCGLGADGGGSTAFWGNLDEVSVYGRVLSTPEIQSIVYLGSTGKSLS